MTSTSRLAWTAMLFLGTWSAGCRDHGTGTSATEASAGSQTSASTGQGRVGAWRPETAGPRERAAEPLAWTLSLQLPAGATGPRIAELFLETTGNLAFESAEPGAAAQAAGKEVVVQPRAGNILRLLIYSAANTDSLGAGTLATLHFRRVADGQTAVGVRYPDSAFAPADLTVSPETVRVEGQP